MKTYLNTILIALSVVIASIVFANAITNRNRSNNTIAVTGLGSKNFVSDLIVWEGSFNQKSLDLKEASAQLDKDRESIKKYLLSKGLTNNNLVFSAVDIQKEFATENGENGNVTKSVFTGYQLKQSVHIESTEVNKVENISREVSELINSGIEFYSDPPQYYYTKLAELKIEMIADATKDAKTRAQRIAENAGSNLSRLKKADLGVFQIVAQNSSEEYAPGGSFNTSSKRKTATVTVRLEYETK